MATESLKIVIGADLGGAIANFNNLTVALTQTGEAAAGASALFAKIPASLRPINPAQMNALRDAVIQFKKEIGNIPKPPIPPIPPIPDPFKKVIPGANAAGFALTNVGRVAQDLPFGFIGIQNNLNPLLESFQRLKAETGSTGAALKSLGSSLIGPAGIGLALSLVSAAFVIFQNGIAGFNKKTKEAKEEAEKFVDSLKSIGDITSKATASVEGEIAQVSALAAAVGNANLPYKERKRALDELKDTNKSYFGDLKLEDAITGKLANTVNEYTKALVQQAVIKGFSDEISRVAVELSKQEKALKASQDNLTRLQTALSKTKQSETSLTGEDRISQKYIDAKNAVADADKAFKDQRTTVEKLRTNFVELQGAIDSAVTQSLQFKSLTATADKEAEDGLKKRIEALNKLRDAVGLTQAQQIELVQLEVQLARRDGVKLGFTRQEIDDQVEALIKKAFPETGGEFVNIRQKISVGGELDFSQVKLDLPKTPQIDIATALGIDEIDSSAFDNVIKALQDGAARTRAALDLTKFNIEASAAGIQEAIVGAFEGLGTAIGEALSGGSFSGVLGKFGETLLKIVGGVLQDIGKQIIVASKLVVALKKVLSSVGLGAASLVVGLALVALGGVLKNIKFSTPQFEKGGIASGPRSGYLATLHGTELIIPMNKIDKRPSTGGIQGQATVPIILQAGGVIEGQSLRILLNRVDRSNGRMF